MTGKPKPASDRSKTGDILFILLWIALLLVLFFQTLSLGRMAALVPLVVILPTLGLLVTLLILKLRSAHDRFWSVNGRDAYLKSADMKILEQDAHDRGRTKISLKDEIMVIAWTAFLLSSICLLGFLAAVPLYAFLYLKLGAGEGWRISIFTSASMFLLLYLFFYKLLEFYPYTGNLWGWIGF